MRQWRRSRVRRWRVSLSDRRWSDCACRVVASTAKRRRPVRVATDARHGHRQSAFAAKRLFDVLARLTPIRFVDGDLTAVGDSLPSPDMSSAISRIGDPDDYCRWRRLSGEEPRIPRVVRARWHRCRVRGFSMMASANCWRSCIHCAIEHRNRLPEEFRPGFSVAKIPTGVNVSTLLP